MTTGHDPIRDSRVSYEKASLELSDVVSDPFAQAKRWLDEAVACKDVHEPNAVTVATADGTGRPSARIVLLRGQDARGFVFFTNYESRKGRELAENPHAALLFFWDPLERELRIEGAVEKIGPKESDAYFARRPRGHRLSAWASPQSAPVEDRAVLERAMTEAESRFLGDVPRPPYWGGYRLLPVRFEFWQGRRNRIHDRLQYDFSDGVWQISRRAP